MSGSDNGDEITRATSVPMQEVGHEGTGLAPPSSSTAGGGGASSTPSHTSGSSQQHHGASSGSSHAGAGTTEGDAAAADTSTLAPTAAARLDALLFPSDIYTSDKRYWADLPFGEKHRWILRQNGAEAKRELGVIGRMAKADPLEPVRAYFRNYVVTGLGLFVEGFTLFSVGNLSILFKVVWPECFSTHRVCSKASVSAIDYLQIVGIIVGQIVVGIECDWIGRRFGMVQDALVMLLGSVMLTAMWGADLQGWVAMYAVAQFVYGFGVGGEYPVVGASAMEKAAGKGTDIADRMHRGRRVALSFLMQGWGQLANIITLILLLLITNTKLGPGVSEVAAQYTFRASFGIISAITLFLAYLRYYKIRTVDAELRAAKRRLNTSGYDSVSLKLARSHYGGRLIATCFSWLAADFNFYGARVFSSVFIGIITGQRTSIQTTWLWQLLITGVQLVGYYVGALLIDYKGYGRKYLQGNGFLILFILTVIATFDYDYLSTPGGLHRFQAMYVLLSFFNQAGPNTTTFLTASEVYPSSIRATAMGVSAACGKLGALMPAVIFNYVDNKTKFLITTWFALAGFIATMIFLPDTTGLDLREQERYWKYVRDGREKDYHGVAVHPRHLSLWERVVLKRHLAYDAELDRQSKIDEMRAVYDSLKSINDVDATEHDLSHEQKEFLEGELAGFFASERKLSGRDVPADMTTPSRLAKLERKLG